MLADNEQARRFRTRSATAWHALLEGSRDVLPTSAHSGLSGSLPANVARAQPAPSRMPESEQFESISRQFVDGRYWARTSDLLLVRQSWAGGDRYATVQIARNRGGFNRSVARSTTSRGGKHVRKKFGRAKTGPAAASAARPRRSPSLPQCGRASSFVLGLASTARSLPRGPAAPAQAPRDARSSLTRSLGVWRRQPEGPRALDGVCPAVGGDCRSRLCVPGSSSAGRATFSP